MRKDLIGAFAAVRDLHQKLYGLIVQIDKPVQTDFSMEECADTSLWCREVEELLKDSLKDIRGIAALANRHACLQWVRRMTGEPIRTDYTTASPKVGVNAEMPKHGTPEYLQMMAALGVPAERASVVRPHWPDLMDHFTELTQAGRPLPPGVDTTTLKPTYMLHQRKKRDILEGADKEKAQ